MLPAHSSQQLDFSNLEEAVEELARIADAIAAAPAAAAAPQQQDRTPSSSEAEAAASPSSSEAGGDADSAAQQQLTVLQADNERLEADRLEMGQRLGEYRATVAKVRARGSLARGCEHGWTMPRSSAAMNTFIASTTPYMYC